MVCQIQGQTGFAQTCYGGKALLKGREDGYNGQVENLYEAGAVRNIATFYEDVIERQLRQSHRAAARWTARLPPSSAAKPPPAAHG